MIYDENICTLGEGPLWHPTRNELFWFDILSCQLRTKNAAWTFDEYVSAAGWVDDTTLIVASQSALWRFDIEGDDCTMLVPLEADNPITRSNDGRADPQGGFWIGTMGINAEFEAGAIYRYYKGELRQLFKNLTITNAICFAPSGDLAYFADTGVAKVWRVKLDAEGWPIGEPDLFLDLDAEGLNPDGAVVDAEGNFWNAQWGANRVAKYDQNGVLIEAVSFPAEQTSCPAFGGPDLKTLFVTTAADGLTGEHEGKTYFAEVTATGQREHQVILA